MTVGNTCQRRLHITDRFGGSGSRNVVNASLTKVEDAVYVGLGVILAAMSIYLLGSTVFRLVIAVGKGAFSGEVITLLDQVLLILLIVELLYTVKVSLRAHTLVAQPFLVVALIATVRKILVLGAQLSSTFDSNDIAFRHSMEELGLLSMMMLVLVGSLILLQRQGASPDGPANREEG